LQCLNLFILFKKIEWFKCVHQFQSKNKRFSSWQKKS
jgi:hypothetical protein